MNDLESRFARLSLDEGRPPVLPDADVAYALHDTPIGTLLLASAEGKVVASSFGDEETMTTRLARAISPEYYASPAAWTTYAASWTSTSTADGTRSTWRLTSRWPRLSNGWCSAICGTTPATAVLRRTGDWLARSIGRRRLERSVRRWARTRSVSCCPATG